MPSYRITFRNSSGKLRHVMSIAPSIDEAIEYAVVPPKAKVIEVFREDEYQKEKVVTTY